MKDVMVPRSRNYGLDTQKILLEDGRERFEREDKTLMI